MSPPPDNAHAELRRIADELERLTAVIDGSKRYNTPGVLPMLDQLQSEVGKLRSSVAFLRIVCALLCVISIATLLAVIFLVQAHP
jgi:hypothetical protein